MSILPLTLDDVVLERSGRRLLDRVSCVIDRPGRTVVLGPNGAGKSVLLRVCHGLLTPTAGRVRWGSHDAVEIRGRQAMVFQRPVMLRRSARANVAYALSIARAPRDERERRTGEALELVGLAHVADRPARVLSGGEQQRLALARAWTTRPEVLFLDEPTASLDPAATAEIERIVVALHERGTKIVMVTHNLGQARRLADEILFIDHGRLIERTPADVFFDAPRSGEAAQFLRGELPWSPRAASPIVREA